ncbi:hypothetical protein [Sutterella wadsworthensis]|nr:hypothetical protein [Sutterella wadsworthensis]
MLTKARQVNIVPHFGLSFTRLFTDGFTAGFNINDIGSTRTISLA